MSERRKSFAERRAEQRARELRTCRHFTGIQNEACKVGIRYREMRDASGPGMARWPCTGDEGCVTTCAKYEPRTPEEIDAEEAEFRRRFAVIPVARKAIVATKQPAGAVDCPLCKAPSALRFRVSSYNGHVHAACSTPKCLSWME